MLNICKVCGQKLVLTKEKHYVARDEEEKGLQSIVNNTELTLYDTFDCEVCGSQNIVGERKRVYECYEDEISEEETKESDNVNSPKHYNKHNLECIEEMAILFGEKAVIDFCTCNAWKYRERAPYKGKQEEDDKKADWYISKAKELEERMVNKNERKDK